MIDANKEQQPIENSLEMLEKKIAVYSSLKTKKEEGESGEFDIPDDGEIKIDMPQEPVLAESGMEELKMPSVEEMKEDFFNLAEQVEKKHEAGAIPSSLWMPLKELMEKYLASEAVPADVETRWSIFEPIYRLFVKNEDYLKQPEIGVIGGSVNDWIGTVDRVMGENLPRLTANK